MHAAGSSSITPEIEALVLAKIAEGIPLRELARNNGFSKSAWYRKLEADADLAGRFARARDEGFDALAEETLDIADNGTNDWMKRTLKDGREVTVLDADHVQRSKLRIETRLKLLAKWSPKKYGEHSTLDLGNKDGEALKIETDAPALVAKLAGQMRLTAANPAPEAESGEDLV